MSDLVRLLGRDPIDLRVSGEYLSGCRVLVTGAGGSIGAELCRQVARWAPVEVVLVGHGESSLAATAAATDCPCRIEVADIRDIRRMVEVFGDACPDVVFHAAALKHQPILQQQPGEAVKTNVYGTANVLVAAQTVGVEALVNVSTDKACEPACVLGASKRIGERIVSGCDSPSWTSIRLANVIGSRGSVLTTFARQLAAGLPLTVTSPDIDRLFMTAQEAAQLAIFAAMTDYRGGALVLDVGKPIRIVDVARRMAALMGVDDPAIVYTGLRPGEKLHEKLIGNDEHGISSCPGVTLVSVPPLDEAVVHEARIADGAADRPADVVREWLTALAESESESAVACV